MRSRIRIVFFETSFLKATKHSKTRAQTYLGVIAGVDSVINRYDVLFQKMKPVSFKANLKTTNHENDHYCCMQRIGI